MIVEIIVLYETFLRYIDKGRMYFLKDNSSFGVPNSQEMGRTILVVKYINHIIFSLLSGYIINLNEVIYS